MHLRKLALLCQVAWLALGTSAHPADAIAYPVSTSAELPIHNEQAFDWSGFYAGLYGVADLNTSSDDGYGVGLNVGLNAAFDFYLVGAEVAFQGVTSGSGQATYADILARGGLLATDDVLVYASAGYGLTPDVLKESNLMVGAGAELAVTNNVSIRAQYLHGFPISGQNDKDQVTFGANFHF